MEHAIERRQGGAARMAFEEKVDVGGELLAPFEANAVDVSRDGLHLVGPVLPELGQPLSCRFSVGESQVICDGTVVWRQEGAHDHEFGLRFTALDSESARALSALLSAPPSGAEAPLTQGSPNGEVSPRGARIRLHIEGLGAPMRARVREADANTVLAQSELGFLQLGKELELEDAVTGQKRAVRIDQVDVELDAQTRVPQLVVGLAYLAQQIRVTEVPDTDPEQPEVRAELSAPVVVAAATEDSEIAEESARMKGPLALTFAKITPAVVAQSQKAYLAMKTLWQKRQAEAIEPKARRTTAAAPGGGVATKARRATRGPNSMPVQHEIADGTPKGRALVFARTHKRKLAAGGALSAAALLAGLALGQTREEKPLATLPAPAPLPMQITRIPEVPPPAPAAAPTPADLPALGNTGAAEDELEAESAVAASKQSHPARPFGRGKIEHGKSFRMKMDGPIDDIQGAQLPEGFLVTVPHVRSLEGAGTLFKSDPRVLKAKIDNTTHGAELELTFKDGTPSYVVRARGETLEIVLSTPEKGEERTAKNDKKHDERKSDDKKKSADKKHEKSGLERASLKSSGRKRSH